MEKDKKSNSDKSKDNQEQTDQSIQGNFPIKNAMTDDVKNAALETPGLNQTKTTEDDLFPSDGDNLTNNE